MAKKIQVRILPDGTIQAETIGISGPSCTGYIRTLEDLLEAEAFASAYKPEYYQTSEDLSETLDVGQTEVGS
jgi:hypothetical protein